MASEVYSKLLQLLPKNKNISIIILSTFGLAATFQLTWKMLGILKTRREKSKKLKKFTGPEAHWFFGNMLDIPKGQGHIRLVKLYQIHGPAWRIRMGPTRTEIVLATPEFIQRVMSTSEPKDWIYPLLNPWIGDGLLLSSGKKWFRNRRLLTPSFHFDILKPYQRLFSESAMVLVRKWQGILAENTSGEFPLELFEPVSLFTLDSLMKCIFSNESNFQKDGKKNPYINAVFEIGDILIDRIRYPPFHSDLIFYFSNSGYRLRRAMQVSHAFTRDVIRAKRQEKKQLMASADATSKNDKVTATQQKPTKKYLDFLDMLLDCRDEEGNGLTDKEIEDEVDTFMFEGHDTTASGISWCLYNLASHQHHQEECRKEIEDVLQDREEVEWSDLPKLPYLTKCIKESLRLHPPVTRIGRNVTKDILLPDGRVIPEGTAVAMNIYACHHNPDVWTDPELFDPERFSPENSVNRHSYAYVPFSAGPRNCIGQNFAMNELKTVVALVIKHFKLTVDEKRTPTKMLSLTLKATDGIWLKFELVK